MPVQRLGREDYHDSLKVIMAAKNLRSHLEKLIFSLGVGIQPSALGLGARASAYIRIAPLGPAPRGQPLGRSTSLGPPPLCR